MTVPTRPVTPSVTPSVTSRETSTENARPLSPPILRGGFRLFFLGAALLGALAVPLWAAMLGGQVAMTPAIDPLSWHRHEMIFGFAGAAVIGFVLTAIANWTGRPLLVGAPVAMLFLLWMLARMTLAMPGAGPVLAMLAEGLLFLAAAGFAVREVVAAGNRNLPIAAAVALLGTAAMVDLASLGGLIGATDLGWRAGLALIAILMALIGGRIIPAFTRNWLVKNRLAPPHPAMPGRADMLIVAATALALVGWATGAGEAGGVGAPVLGALLLTLAAAHLWRAARWQGWRTVRDPLVAVLHVAYIWLPVALGLMGLHALGADLPRSAGVHALGAGGAGLLILAVMSRASLGHTGRPLAAGRWLTLAYVLVLAGAAVRVATALGWLGGMMPLHLAATLWAGGFALFAWLYWPILTRAHIGDPSR